MRTSNNAKERKSPYPQKEGYKIRPESRNTTGKPGEFKGAWACG
jgi:hypothetical protein